MGDADAPLKDLVQLGLVKQLGMAGFVGLELDGHFLSIGDVNAYKNGGAINVRTSMDGWMRKQ